MPVMRWTRGLFAGVVAAAIAACGLPAPAGMGVPPAGPAAAHALASLVVVPTVEAGYATQSLYGPYVRASIVHVVLSLARLVGDPTNPTEEPVLDAGGAPVTLDVAAADLGEPVNFRNLFANTRYRVRAAAYQAPGVAEADLISTTDATSYVDVTLGSDDAPSMATLRVRLRDRNVYVGPIGASVGLPEGAGTGPSDEGAPQAAYHPTRQEWLLVWQDDRHGYPTVYARRLTRAGAPVGAEVRVAAGVADSPAVALSATTGEYLVVWKQDRGATGADVVGRRLAGDGTPTGAEIVISESASLEQYRPRVAHNPTADEYLVAWYEERGATGFDVMGRRLDGDGTPLGADLAISAGAGAEQYLPRLAFNAAWNEYLVVWHELRAGSWDVMGRRVAATGAALGADFQISGAANTQEQATVVANPTSGECLVVWQEDRGTTGSDIIGRRVTAGGVVVASDITIAIGATHQFQPTAALDPVANEYLVGWVDGTTTAGYDLKSRRVRYTGTFPGVEGTLSARPANQTEPALAIDTGTGTALAAWNEPTAAGRDIVFNLAAGAATALSAPTKAYAPQTGVRIARNPSANNHLVAWLEGQAVKAMPVDHAGQPLGAAQTVASTAGAKAALAMAFNATAGEFFLVWQEYRGNKAWDVVGRRVGPTGVVAGGEIVVSESGQPQELPAVAYDQASNAYLVVWQEQQANAGCDIKGRRVAATGAGIGADFVVSATANQQEQPALAFSAATADYLVVWSEHRGATGWDIVGKRVRADGTLNGADVVISAATYSQEAPALALNAADGQYLVAWQEYRTGATDYEITARRVSTAGAVVNPEFVVAATANAQELPAVAFNPTSREYLIVWQEARAGTGLDVLARRVDAAGSLIGLAFEVGAAALDQAAPGLAYSAATNDFLAAWTDGRNAPGGTNPDVFLQLVDTFAGR